jgi:D-threonate/D-erythronate kinase
MAIGDTLLPHEVIVIADDLTGACDTAVAFSMKGMKTEVILDWGPARDFSTEVIAIDTESRDIPAPEARRKLEDAADQLNLKRFTHIFKKVDSVFRGNTLNEIVAAIEKFPFDLAIMAPAYPRLGRTSRDGIVRVCDLYGERSFAVRDGLEASGLKICHIAVGSAGEEMAEVLVKNLHGECQLVYCDAMSERDLQVIVTEGRRLAVRTLWIGSAGLAHALAFDLVGDNHDNLSSETSGCHPSVDTSASIFFFTGSDHLATQMQIIALRQEHHVVEYAFDGSKSDDNQGTGIFLVPVRRGVTTELDISSTLKWIRPNNVSCLFMTGGDTATLVCRALGIRGLQLQDEFAPGLPRGLAVGGALAGLPVILKSGGFGETDVLCRIVEAYQPDVKARNEVAH